ncbi:hypothetical protein AR456_03125 [Halomonas huangheensis]|nr:hypothetical protein AR456_03125 [Halomonas huangheensis]
MASIAPTHYAAATPFYSPEAPEKDAPPFEGEAELGYTQLSGNSNSETLLGKGELSWITGLWMHSLRGEIRHASEDDETSAERYLGSMRERRELDGPNYLFGFGRWEKDRFSGYDHQLTAITGYGRQLIDSPTANLTLEAGPGYRADAIEGEEDEQWAVAYGALEAGYQLSESASLEQELSVEGTEANTTTRSLSALDTRINAHMSLRLSHEIKHNSAPPEDVDSETDRTTSASLRYSF